MKIIAVVIMICCLAHTVSARVPAEFSVPSSDVGTTIELTGRWGFQPSGMGRYLTVPVPQMLSRIQWWLDDSEDFKKWEQARLDALGFDTEKSDDGWYRADISVPKLPKDRHLWVEFDGVAMRSKTYINDQLLGSHDGMFSRFAYDLTPHLKVGRNWLKVWVGMERMPESTAQLGEAVTVNIAAGKIISMSKGMFGPLTVAKNNREYDLYGIWQPVKLVVRGAGRMKDVWFVPTLTGGTITIDASSRVPVKATAKFTDPKSGKVLAEWSAPLQDAQHAIHLSGYGLKPKLWTPARPNLYRLDVSMLDEAGNLIDHWSQRVGFRTFTIEGNKFLLNGHPYWLRGANQLPYGKNPWDPELARKLIQLTHDGNQTWTRTHCTPWNEAWLDAADEIGLAVSIEGIRPWGFAGRSEEGLPPLLPPPAIYQHWLMENADVIKRCRNHPSVIMWTVGNEMNLRDGGNIAKWELLSGVVKQTRLIDPTRPVVSTSSYHRERKQYEEDFKPAGIDDGDVDDVHYYNGWYGNSNFTRDSKFQSEMKENQKKRPLISQEMSSGYPDLDTGLPVLRYTRDLLTPQAWVGNASYPGNDPAIWLDHHAKVTKRWAEQLRYERGDVTAGFCLFSSECWYHHSYEPSTVKPYLVYEAVKQAFAPVSVAIETTQRRWWAGDRIATDVHVTNDHDDFKDLSDLTVHLELMDGSKSLAKGEAVKIAKLPYYAQAKVAVRCAVPASIDGSRQRVQLVTALLQGKKEISRSADGVELFARRPPLTMAPANVIVIKRGEALVRLIKGGDLHDKIAAGATAIVLSPRNQDMAYLFPHEIFNDDIERLRAERAATTRATTRRAAAATMPGYKAPATRKATTAVAAKPTTMTKASTKPSTTPAAERRETYVEFADISPAAGTKLAENLEPMDLKWWARENDWRAHCGTTSVRLRPGGKGRELIRYIPAHGYIAEDKLPEQYRTVLCEIPIGKGRLWICNLDIEASADVDPAANIFRANLYRAAGDPESTKLLPTIPSHEALLKSVK